MRWKTIRLFALVGSAILLWANLTAQSTFHHTYHSDNGAALFINQAIASADNHYYLLNTISEYGGGMPSPLDVALCIDANGMLQWLIGDSGEIDARFHNDPAMFERNGALHYPKFDEGALSVVHYYSDGSYQISVGDSIPFDQGYSLDGFRFDADHQVVIAHVVQGGHEMAYLICYDVEGSIAWMHTMPENIAFCQGGVKIDADHLMFICGGELNHTLLVVTDNLGNEEYRYDYAFVSSLASTFGLSSDENGRVLIVYTDASGTVRSKFDLYQNNTITPLFFQPFPTSNRISNAVLDGETIAYADSIGIHKTDLMGMELWHLQMPAGWSGYYPTTGGWLIKTPDGGYLLSCLAAGEFGVLKCTSDGEPVSESLTPLPLLKLNAYPNPFQDKLTLSFELKAHQPVEVKVYNVKGQMIKRLNSVQGKTGWNEVLWDGKDNNGIKAAQGVYLLKALVDGKDTVKRVVKLK